MGTNDGGAISSIEEDKTLIVLPITQFQMILSMVIAEVSLLSDPGYTVTIGTENYFSLAVGAFVGGIFIFAIIAIKLANSFQFKDARPKVIMEQKITQK